MNWVRTEKKRFKRCTELPNVAMLGGCLVNGGRLLLLNEIRVVRKLLILRLWYCWCGGWPKMPAFLFPDMNTFFETTLDVRRKERIKRKNRKKLGER